MELNFKREIENSIVSTTITIKEFGSGENGLSSNAEEECLRNWRIELNYENMLFDGFVTIDENHLPSLVSIPEQEDNPEQTEQTEPIKPDGDRIQFSVIDDAVIVDKDMEIIFKVDANELRLKDSYTHLQDTKDYAMAMILVFEDTVKRYISEKMKENIVHYNGFEKEFSERI